MTTEGKTTPDVQKYLTIKAAAQHLGIAEQYVRKLVHEGKFPGAVQKPIGDTEVSRWEIPLESVDARKEGHTGRTSRIDGRNKYIIYLSKDELATVQKLLTANELSDVPFDRANTPEDVAKRVAKSKEKRHAAREQKKRDLAALKQSIES